MTSIRNLDGKKVLLFAPQGKGIYGTAIFNELIEKGADVYIFNERPSTSTLSKILYRTAKRFLRLHFASYINHIIHQVKHISFDYILIIRGEAFSPNEINSLRINFPKAKLVLYLWDSFKNCDTRRIFPYFDRILSFDREDCKQDKRLIFRPLFFSKDYERIAGLKDFEYDLVFIGTVHSDRLLLLKNMMRYLQSQQFRIYSYLYFPSRLLFFRKKLSDKNFKGYSISDFNYKMIPAKRVSELLSKSKVSLDMQAPTQSGLTMRTIEVLGAKRKLITTNKQIKQYDFYNEKNIQVIDLNFSKLDLDFFDTPFYDVPNNIYEKYSLRNWINEVLDVDKIESYKDE